MLSHQEILKRCESGRCLIALNYDAESNRIYPVDGREGNESVAKSITNADLKAVRMSITLGPVVKKQNSGIKKEYRFKGKRNLVDLTKCEGKLIISPREMVSILSNEYFRLDGSTSALIIPRLTLADIGVGLIPTYIDPFWDGILQMSLVNNTISAYELKLGEPIAQCFFFNIAGEVSNSHRDAFPRKSHHFGQTWEKILQEDAEPFPKKKRIENIRLIEKFKYLTHDYKKLLSALLKTGFLFTVLIAVGKFYNLISRTEKELEKLPDIKEQVAKLERQQLQDAKRFVTKGFQEVTIPFNKKTAKIKVPVNIVVSGNSTVLSNISSKRGVAVFEVTAGKMENSILKEINIYIEMLEAAKQDTNLKVDWVIVP